MKLTRDSYERILESLDNNIQVLMEMTDADLDKDYTMADRDEDIRTNEVAMAEIRAIGYEEVQ